MFLYVKSLKSKFHFEKQLCHESLERKTKFTIFIHLFIHLPVPCLHHAWTTNFFKPCMTGTSKNLRNQNIIDTKKLTRPNKTQDLRDLF